MNLKSVSHAIIFLSLSALTARHLKTQSMDASAEISLDEPQKISIFDQEMTLKIKRIQEQSKTKLTQEDIQKIPERKTTITDLESLKDSIREKKLDQKYNPKKSQQVIEDVESLTQQNQNIILQTKVFLAESLKK